MQTAIKNRVNKYCQKMPVSLCNAPSWFALCLAGTPAQLEEAVAAGADVNEEDGDGITPLMLAAGYNNWEAAEVLIRAGARVDAVDSLSRTPLMFAIEHNGTVRTIRNLIQAGADPNASDLFCQTPLPLAKMHRRGPAILAALVEGGAK